MELPKAFEGKLTPKARNIITHRVFEQSEKEERSIILPKDVLLSILDDTNNSAYPVIRVFNIDIQDLLVDILSESPTYHSPPANKSYHESFFQLMKISEKVCREMESEQIGCIHIILAFLRYTGKSKHILNYKIIFEKYGIEYSTFYEGVSSIINEIAEDSPKKRVRRSRRVKLNSQNTEKQTKKKASPKNLESQLTEMGIIKNLNETILKSKEKIVERQKYIERCIKILCRKKKSNPIIIGSPGIGKTSLVNGIVSTILEQKVPKKMANTLVYEVLLGNTVAGTKYRGQFEERMKNVISFFCRKKDEFEKIAFIDEIHHVIKAGSAEGSVDASFMLKPKLADGSLKCIGVTTFDEFRKLSLNDKALARRFSPVFLEEPTVEQTVKILELVKDEYEEFHSIKISKDCIEKCVNLADTYIKDKFFPDKAFDVLDESCSKLSYDSKDAKDNLELKSIIIEQIVSDMTGIPLASITSSEKEKLAKLEDNIKKEVIGQERAVNSVCNSIKRARLGFKDKNKPMGCYLFIGKTGVGKTYLTKKLSENLFGTNNLIRLDMSEYMEKHSISRIIGAAPGYIGYDDGGQLSERVKEKPYSVILLDEIEKAHRDVVNLFLQILDEGRLTDSFGRLIDFRNTIIIMTSNLSASKLNKINNKLGFNKIKEYTSAEEMESFLKKETEDYFPPEFINRLDDIIVFNDFSEKEIKKILDLEINKTKYRLAENGYIVEITDQMKDFIFKEGYSEKFGARPIYRAIAANIEVPLANKYFNGLISNEKTIVVDYKDEEITIYNK